MINRGLTLTQRKGDSGEPFRFGASIVRSRPFPSTPVYWTSIGQALRPSEISIKCLIFLALPSGIELPAITFA